MRLSFLILIAIVFISTIFFAVIIWRQLIKFEKKALAAKRQKEAYVQQLMLELQEQDYVDDKNEKEDIPEKID
ncbi:MAG: hypothetical protein H5T98_00550 [Syntrophomonadaceae bacterium]|nr:hypothetical protein [Syntrophomonadaceae bacterium]